MKKRRTPWDGCLGEDCASYDPARDVDRMFDGGETPSGGATVGRERVQ